ncbi:hypothetical protein F4776DRAFT_479171 [Hypoxylon sp. NC0597]|nr:hypothetical protein F4776DRAFT_479171 [Hypoxylon sp. NC0597]
MFFATPLYPGPPQLLAHPFLGPTVNGVGLEHIPHRNWCDRLPYHWLCCGSLHIGLGSTVFWFFPFLLPKISPFLIFNLCQDGERGYVFCLPFLFLFLKFPFFTSTLCHFPSLPLMRCF